MDITNFDLTKELGPSKKCWYLCPPSSREALAAMIGGEVACDGRVLSSEEINRTHRVSQMEDHWPGDGGRDGSEQSYSFAPGQ